MHIFIITARHYSNTIDSFYPKIYIFETTKIQSSRPTKVFPHLDKRWPTQRSISDHVDPNIKLFTNLNNCEEKNIIKSHLDTSLESSCL